MFVFSQTTRSLLSLHKRNCRTFAGVRGPEDDNNNNNNNKENHRNKLPENTHYDDDLSLYTHTHTHIYITI